MKSLYIHIPFCRKKCNYCDFASSGGAGQPVKPYVKALCAEMKRCGGDKIDTIYAGGGTPTILEAEDVTLLYNAVKSCFDCSGIIESTYEANPESVDAEKLEALKNSGVNRLSIGAQSLKPEELSFLGRIHTAEEFRSSFRLAREAGFNNISVDLIYGIPGQDLAGWRVNLEQLVELDPEHISCYPLTVEFGTPFYDRHLEIDDEAQAQMYEYAIEYLASKGYEHYEISNWAKPQMRSLHNMNYWNNGQYIGIGAAAASHTGNTRKTNNPDIAAYIKSVSENDDPAVEIDELTDEKAVSESIVLKLRCREGLELSNILRQKYGGKIEKLVQDDLLEYAGSSVRLSRKGLLLANQVWREFV